MSDEPIRISSESWTGLTQGTAVEERPKPRRKPNRLKGLFASFVITLVSGAEVFSAITTHVVHRRADFISRVRTVQQAEHPTLFSMHASGAFVIMLAGSAMTIVLLVDYWREKIKKRRSWFDRERA